MHIETNIAAEFRLTFRVVIYFHDMFCLGRFDAKHVSLLLTEETLAQQITIMLLVT